jgi:MFS family permease
MGPTRTASLRARSRRVRSHSRPASTRWAGDVHAWIRYVQALGIGVVAIASSFAGWALGSVLLGVGTAMVYPTLLAAIGDAAHPSWRASAVGAYRLWRDSGYAVGALLAGVLEDLFGPSTAVWAIAALTAASGLVVALRMYETHRPKIRPST